MLQNGFEIDITKDSVDVRRDDSNRSRRGVILLSGGFVAFAALIFYWMVLASPHGNPSSWEVIHDQAKDRDFAPAVLGLIIGVSISGMSLLIGIRVLFPSGDALRCDRSTFTVSEIPWLNLRGKWKSQAYALADISQLQFGVISSTKGNTIYGLRFLAAGKRHKIFTGLQAPEANKILQGLRTLGADVPNDPDMHTRIEETLRARSMELDNR
jgi:hypothetical protein